MKKTFMCLLLATAGVLCVSGMLMAERSDLPTSLGGSYGAPPEERVSRALFGALHERTVDSFSKRVGFGFSRLAAAPRNHIDVEDLWTILPPQAAGYDVALIGLENDAKGRVYTVATIEQQEREDEEEKPGQIHRALAGDNEVAQIAVVAGELVELDQPPRQVRISPASPLDREMLEQLAADLPAPMLTDGGDKVMIYGAVRARQQRCIECHECEPGTLLGAFRYTFDLAPVEVAAVLPSAMETE